MQVTLLSQTSGEALWSRPLGIKMRRQIDVSLQWEHFLAVGNICCLQFSVIAESEYSCLASSITEQRCSVTLYCPLVLKLSETVVTPGWKRVSKADHTLKRQYPYEEIRFNSFNVQINSPY